MSTSTPNIQLVKPAGSELVDEAVLNANMDKIDAKVGFNQFVTVATKPGAPFNGQVIYLTDVKMPQFWNGSKWMDMRPRAVRKSATETVNNSSTFQNDDELLLPMEANSEYILDMFIRYQAAAAADIKGDCTGPSGFSFFAVLHRLTTAATTEADDRIDTQNLGSDTMGLGGITSSTKTSAHLSGTVKTGGTAGNLQFRWAQFTANATDAQVLEGSYMRLQQIA